MENQNLLAALSNYLGPEHTNPNGNLHFKARIIYKWANKMQQDVADVNIVKDGDDIEHVIISNTRSMPEDTFILSFSPDKQAFKLEADNTILIVTGNDKKLHGDYSVEIIPER